MSVSIGRLTRVTGGGNLRTPTVDGTYTSPPMPGEHFDMLGVPLDPEANVRVVSTSVVQEVTETREHRHEETMSGAFGPPPACPCGPGCTVKYVFRTLNSTYRLDVLVADAEPVCV